MFEGNGSAVTGFSSETGLLSTTLEDGYFPIESSSPAINASVGDYSVYFMNDVFAGARSGTFDVGAHEYGATIEKGPYTQADVGVTLGFGAIEPAAGPSLNANPSSLNYSVNGESLTFNITANISNQNVTILDTYNNNLFISCLYLFNINTPTSKYYSSDSEYFLPVLQCFIVSFILDSLISSIKLGP